MREIAKKIFKILFFGSHNFNNKELINKAVEALDCEHNRVTGSEVSVNLNYTIKKQQIQLQLLNTKEDNKLLESEQSWQKFTQNIDCIVMVYDICDKASYDELTYDLDFMKKKNVIDENVLLVLVGNRKEDCNKRVISVSKGQHFASGNKLLFVETSTATGKNVKELFDLIIHRLVKK